MRLRSIRVHTSGLASLFVLTAVALLPAQQLPFEQVVARLKAADSSTRLNALKLLAESGYPEAAGPVAPLLSDPDPRVRREALYAELGFFVPASTAKKRVALVTSRRDPAAARTAFESRWGAMPGGRVPIDVVTGLLTPLKDSTAAMREEAAYALGVLGQVDGVAPDAAYRLVVEALAERLGDGEPAVRIAAARASGRVFRRCPGGCGIVPVERLGDALVRLLNDTQPGVQGAAMEALGEIRYERAIKTLSEVLSFHRSGETAWAALDTLARIGNASLLPTFKAALSSRDPNFRRSAVEGLARAGGEEATTAIDAATGAERDAPTALAIAFAQQRLGRGSQARRLIAALDDRALKQQAQDYLVELGVAEEAAGALGSASVEARVALLEVLGMTGTAREGAVIERLQNDPDPRVAAAARQALARVRLDRR